MSSMSDTTAAPAETKSSSEVQPAPLSFKEWLNREDDCLDTFQLERAFNAGMRHGESKSAGLLKELEAAHDTLDIICLAGHMHLVSAALPKGHGMDTFREAISSAKGGA